MKLVFYDDKEVPSVDLESFTKQFPIKVMHDGKSMDVCIVSGIDQTRRIKPLVKIGDHKAAIDYIVAKHSEPHIWYVDAELRFNLSVIEKLLPNQKQVEFARFRAGKSEIADNDAGYVLSWLIASYQDSKGVLRIATSARSTTSVRTLTDALARLKHNYLLVNDILSSFTNMTAPFRDSQLPSDIRGDATSYLTSRDTRLARYAWPSAARNWFESTSSVPPHDFGSPSEASKLAIDTYVADLIGCRVNDLPRSRWSKGAFEGAFEGAYFSLVKSFVGRCAILQDGDSEGGLPYFCALLLIVAISATMAGDQCQWLASVSVPDSRPLTVRTTDYREVREYLELMVAFLSALFSEGNGGSDGGSCIVGVEKLNSRELHFRLSTNCFVGKEGRLSLLASLMTGGVTVGRPGTVTGRYKEMLRSAGLIGIGVTVHIQPCLDDSGNTIVVIERHD